MEPRARPSLAWLAWLAAIGLAACDAPACVRRDPAQAQASAEGGGATAPTGSCDEIILGVDPWRDDGAPHGLGDRGAFIGCTHFMSASVAALEAHPAARRDLGEARFGAELFQLRYVTETRPGEASLASALLYAPAGAAGRVPVVLVEHGTTGMGPACGPSRTHETVDALAVPFVARGYAVVAPDYAGLGIDTGMTSYLVGAREAASSLDALRAARRFRDRRFDGTRLGDEVVVVGYSQGGHAALFTHAAFDPSRDGRLVGSVAFAPALGDMRAWKPFFADSARATDSMSLYAAMMLFANAAEHGDGPAREWLSPTAHDALPRLFHDHCLATLGAPFRKLFPLQGDLYAPAFQEAAARCDFDVHGDASAFAPWRARLLAEEPGAFRSDAPALLVTGTADGVVPEATVACIRDRLVRHGTTPRACAYAGATHADIVARAFADVLRWVEGRRHGEDPDVCPEPLTAACPPATAP
jgi:dienelactone hydrolase